MRYMLDTDTCIYLINRHPQLEPRAGPDVCGISTVVLGELERGKRLTQRTDYIERFDRFIAGMAVRNLDAVAAREYAAIRVDLEAKGTPIGPNDLWIAAHARALGVPLVTNNLREFACVPNLAVETWMTA